LSPTVLSNQAFGSACQMPRLRNLRFTVFAAGQYRPKYGRAAKQLAALR
jgi:hypothetical protein